MRFSYSFANLCGAVYNNGNVVFSPDGNVLYSPVGNRVTVFDLVNHSSYTLPFESRQNIACIAISHNGRYLIAVDESGRCVFVNLRKRIVLYRSNFGISVSDIQFSPDDTYIAITHGRLMQIWLCPTEKRHFAPMELLHEYSGHSDEIVCLSWSSDSQYVVTGSLDTTVRLWCCGKKNGSERVLLAGHKSRLVGVYFAEEDNAIYSVAKDGAVFEWHWTKNDHTDEDPKEQEKRAQVEEAFDPDFPVSRYYDGKWKIFFKNYVEEKFSTIDTCYYEPKSKLLACGFSNGIFGIYTMPSSTNIHTLSISQRSLSTCCINSTGEWIAFGSKAMGQLLVWEWQSETYILKQQGHYYNISSLDYSPDGSIIATGGEDSKVKLWNTNTGYCYVTFKDHTANVTGVAFVKSGHALVSCSLDGTVRAFDLIRYRNFRVLTTPSPVQFTCVAVDPSGDVVAAGAADPFNIYIWSLRTGKLLDVLTGHQGPISSLAFDPRGGLLLSTSWDHTAMVWDIFGGANTETLTHNSEVLSCAWRPDGEEACTTTLTGDILVWDVKNGLSKTTIEGRRDITGGRRTTDNVSLKNIEIGKCFNSVCYSSDGQYIVAGGRSKYVCIYCLENRMLIKKYQLSQNRSLEGILDKLNSKNMTEAGALGLLNISDNEDETTGLVLPGVAKGDAAKRTVKNEIRCSCVKFSPSGESFSCSTNQGLLIYSLDPTLAFEPFDIHEDVTPDRIQELLMNEDFSRALVYSLHLNEVQYIKKALSMIPLNQIKVIAKDVPRLFLSRLLQVLCDQLTKTPYLEYYICWCLVLLQYNGEYIRSNPRRYISVLRNLQKVLNVHYTQTQKVYDQNLYLLRYLTKTEGMEETSFEKAPIPEPKEAPSEDVEMKETKPTVDSEDDELIHQVVLSESSVDVMSMSEEESESESEASSDSDSESSSSSSSD